MLSTKIKKNEAKIGMKYKKNRGEVVKESCANFDAVTSHCLLTDKACPLVPFSYRGHKFPTEENECSYFDKYVLGIKEEVLVPEVVPARKANKGKVIYSHKDCLQCGNSFKPTNSRNRYCGNRCKDNATKQKYQRYNSRRD